MQAEVESLYCSDLESVNYYKLIEAIFFKKSPLLGVRCIVYFSGTAVTK